MRHFLVAVLTATALSATAARAEQLTVVSAQDYSSVEFQQHQPNPVQTLDVRSLPPRLYSLPDVNQWIGHSWGTGWDEAQYQAFHFCNLIPGLTYTLNLKFWYKSRPGLAFSATKNGQLVSNHWLDDSDIGRYWAISFVADSPDAMIQIGHNYAGDYSSVAYAYLDYMMLEVNGFIDIGVGPVNRSPGGGGFGRH